MPVCVFVHAYKCTCVVCVFALVLTRFVYVCVGVYVIHNCAII